MPKGLPDVIQKFGADNADYLRALNENRDALRGQVESLEEHRRAVERNQRAVEEFADDLADAQRRLIQVRQAQDELKNSILSGDAMGRMVDDMEAVAVATGKVRAAQDALAREGSYDRMIAGWKAAHREFKSVGDVLTYDVLNGFKRVQVQQDASLMTARQLKTAQEELAVQIRQTGLAAAQTSLQAGAGVDAHRVKLEALRSTVNDVNFGIQMAYSASPGGLPAALAVMRGGGGSGALVTALAVRGGGGGGGAGALMSAAGYADAISGFVGRWATAAHYVVMGTLEALSTILPASVAAGAAGAVGYQAGEQLYGRGAALYATNEALGTGAGTGAYGIPRAYQGVFSNTLQNAQNKYGGGVYALTGGLMQLGQQGSGAFTTMGGNTLEMLAHALASAQVNMQQQGTLGQLNTVLGGGTDYLRQFGAVGANLGGLLLGVGQHLPGVGADWLSALVGLTGAARGGVSFMNRSGLGGLLGAGLAGEAGWRLGTPLVGLAGKGLTGLGGLAGRLGLGAAGMTAAEVAALPEGVTGAVGLGGTGLAGLLGGAGAGLGALTGPVAAAAAVGAFLVSQAWSPRGKGPIASMIGGYQQQVSQAPFADALTPLTHSLSSFNSLLGGNAPPGGWGTVIPKYRVAGATAHELGQQAVQGQLSQAAQQAAQTLGDLAASGPQLVSAISKAGMNGVSFAEALQLASNALITVPQAFGKDHKLNATALKQLGDYMSALIPMTQSPGAFGAVTAAGTIFSSGKVKELQQVNQAMDSAVSLMTAGPVGMSSLFGLLGGTPVAATRAPTRAGIQLSSPPAFHAMAKALASFTTPGGAAAWQTFAGPNGLVPTEQQNLDQIRAAMSLGALTQPQGVQLGAFQLQQLLPLARHSPAALSTLMSMGAGIGIPGMPYFTGPVSGKGAAANLAKEYVAAENATGKIAGNVAQANALTNQMAVNFANLPSMAKQFAQNLAPDVQAQRLAQATTALMGLQDAAAKGGPLGVPLKSLISDMQKAGVQGTKEITGAIDASMKGLGTFSPASQKTVNAQIGTILSGSSLKLDTQFGAGAARLGTGGIHITGQTFTETGKVTEPKPVKPPDVSFGVVGKLHMPFIPNIATKYFDIIGRVSIQGPAGVGGGGSGRLPFIAKGQHGFMVPDVGAFGDNHLAMLERGELVVPRHLVPSVAPMLRGKIPGMQDGGLIGLNSAMSTGILPAVLNENFRILEQQIAAMGGAGGALPIPSPAQKVIDVFEQTFAKMSNPWGQFASMVLQSLLDSIKNPAKETAAEAKALTTKVTNEVNYAKSVAATAVSGLNFGSMSNLPVPTTTAQGKPYQYYIDQASGSPLSVQQQMGDYLQSIKSFSGDVTKLAKGGLNASLLKQLLAAGPLQGDQEAQSILQGQGGIGAVNKLWKQINQAANQLGITGAEGAYGQLKGKTVSAKADVTGAGQVHALEAAIQGLQGKTVTVKVNVELTGSGASILGAAGAGAVVSGPNGGAGHSPPPTNQGRSFQALMLRQAKNNRGTNLTLPGYRS
jgi:hypothetical protein